MASNYEEERRYEGLEESAEYKALLQQAQRDAEQFSKVWIESAGKERVPTWAEVYEYIPDDVAEQVRAVAAGPAAAQHEALAPLRDAFATINEGNARRESLPAELERNAQAQREARATVAEWNAAVQAWDGTGNAPDAGPSILARRDLTRLQHERTALEREDQRLFKAQGYSESGTPVFGSFGKAVASLEDILTPLLQASHWQAVAAGHQHRVATWWAGARRRLKVDARKAIDERHEREARERLAAQESARTAAREAAQGIREAVTA